MDILESAFNNAVLLLQPKVFKDERGYFYESFQTQKFKNLTPELKNVEFVQDNESKSTQNVLRGLHFQAPPYAQGKLIRVIKGSVYDVAVDIRKNSPTYGQSYAVTLSEENKKQLWVPPGFAHGFQTLEEDTIFAYKCTNYYHPESEGCILWSDEDLNIKWPLNHPTLSVKDQKGQHFRDFVSPFE